MTPTSSPSRQVMLWPRRLVLPAEEAGSPLLSRAQLEALLQDDPLLRAERALASQPALKDSAPSMAAAPSDGSGAALDIFFGDGIAGALDGLVPGRKPRESPAGQPWWRRIGSRSAPA